MEDQKNTTICYCFNYTTTDIEQDVLANGRSIIMERIMNDSKKGNCNCAENNPEGR